MALSDVMEWMARALVARSDELAIIACFVVLELAIRSQYLRQLRRRRVAIDLLYAFLFRFGVFTALLDRPTIVFVQQHVTLHAFGSVPEWVRVVAYAIVLDLTNYWIHRVEHAVPALWAVHQVHHSQDELTILSTYRNHPIDTWMRSVFGPTIFMLLFGVSPTTWLGISLVWDVVLNLSHFEVPWTYGPLRHLFVSPVSHAIHHSVEDRHQHRNYGAILSVWDRLFGTADLARERPAQVGLPGWSVPESMPAHIWAPLRGIVRHLRGLPMDDLAPLAPLAPPASSAAAPSPE